MGNKNKDIAHLSDKSGSGSGNTQSSQESNYSLYKSKHN